VNIALSVIDGVSGLPAEGVEVTVVGRPAGERSPRLRGLTDAQGNFTYSTGVERSPNGENYTVEIDVDAYFASLGIVAGYKQLSILVRVASTEREYRIGVLITPFAHATWSVQR
jgi:5-hydroxyisourate hydrolase-like protein (transthyretin family)